MTIERAYTVAEIDALRYVCDNWITWGDYGSYFSTRYTPARQKMEHLVQVEEMVRTHMMAGHTAQDLIDSEREEPSDDH